MTSLNQPFLPQWVYDKLKEKDTAKEMHNIIEVLKTGRFNPVEDEIVASLEDRTFIAERSSGDSSAIGDFTFEYAAFNNETGRRMGCYDSIIIGQKVGKSERDLITLEVVEKSNLLVLVKAELLLPPSITLSGKPTTVTIYNPNTNFSKWNSYVQREANSLGDWFGDRLGFERLHYLMPRGMELAMLHDYKTLDRLLTEKESASKAKLQTRKPKRLNQLNPGEYGIYCEYHSGVSKNEIVKIGHNHSILMNETYDGLCNNCGANLPITPTNLVYLGPLEK